MYYTVRTIFPVRTLLWTISALLRLRKYNDVCLKWRRYHDESSTFADTRRNQFRRESTYLTQPCHRLLFRGPQQKWTFDIGSRLHTLFLLCISSFLYFYVIEHVGNVFALSRKVPFWWDVEGTLRFSLDARPIQVKCNTEAE